MTQSAQQCYPAAVDDAREDVAPELVGAEQELFSRTRALLDEALLGWSISFGMRPLSAGIAHL